MYIYLSLVAPRDNILNTLFDFALNYCFSVMKILKGREGWLPGRGGGGIKSHFPAYVIVQMCPILAIPSSSDLNPIFPSEKIDQSLTPALRSDH